MFTITKEFGFEASHQLLGLPKGHKCGQIHGHSYKVILTLKSDKLNEVGFVVDYRELDEIKKFIDRKLDHRHLNDVFEFNPTAENMARHLFAFFKMKFPLISAVTVKETDKTSATYNL